MVHAPMRDGAREINKPVRILYMEDDSVLAGLIRKRLQRQLYQVDVAEDGGQGLSMYQAASYDLLLLDHYMPVFTGMEVLQTLQARGPLPPVIVLTGRGDETLAVEAMKLGASDYMVKDPEGKFVDLLPMAIERALAHYRLRQEEMCSLDGLRTREELLRLISDTLPLCISYMNTEHQYLFANKTYEQWFGVPVRNIMGSHFGAVWGEAAHVKAQDHLADVMEGRTVRYEDEFTDHDGARRNVSVTHVPHLDRCNTVRGCVSLVSDVTLHKKSEQSLREARDELESRVNQRTQELDAINEQLRHEMRERERAEAELRASEQRFRSIFEASPDSIVVKDRELRYTQVNPAASRMIGKPVSEILGRTSADVFEDETAGQIDEVDRRVLDGQSIEQSATRRIGKDLITVHEVKVPLRDALGKIVGICGIARDVTALRRPPRGIPNTRENYRSPAMKRTMAQAASAANSDSTLLLLGESGTGKDYLARYVHDHSKRSGGQFFAVNCAAVASELAEAELFGHETGAFTGASRRKRGLLELAEGGTLLLNEIGDLSLALQAKLLSFLDTSSFTRVGGESNIRVNARIIAATNRDLHKEIEEGRFRLDLFYRLNVLSITVPPLRERREDLPLLVEQLLTTLVNDLQLGESPRIADRELLKLADYNWPGNVRQLRNVLERALILSREQGNELSFGPLGPREPHPDECSFTVKLSDGLSINDVANQVKRALITETLSRSQGNKQVAAQSLGISRFALFRMMKALNMQEN